MIPQFRLHYPTKVTVTSGRIIRRRTNDVKMRAKGTHPPDLRLTLKWHLIQELLAPTRNGTPDCDSVREEGMAGKSIRMHLTANAVARINFK
jgi:hypothetical protein